MTEVDPAPAFAWRDCPLFTACEPRDWEQVRARAFYGAGPAGTRLWRQDETDSADLFLLLSGLCEVSRSTPVWEKPIILAEYGPGAALGSPPELAGSHHSTSLRLVADSAWLRLDRENHENLARAFPETAARLGRGFLLQERLRLRAVNQRLTALF